jgi:hypothetical protein
METLPVGLIWRALSWLPGFLLRCFFSKAWLAQNTHMDVRPRHEPVLIRGGELPEVEIWLVISNLGHFAIELDRLSAELVFGSAIVRLLHLNRIELRPNTKAEIFIRSSISTEQIAHIARNKVAPYVGLRLQAEFNSRVHNFSVKPDELSGIKPELQNV